MASCRKEETTALGVPCITLRENTERPITVTEGTNVLAGTQPERIVALAQDVIRHGGKRGQRPELWDGRSVARGAMVSRVPARERAVARNAQQADDRNRTGAALANRLRALARETAQAQAEVQFAERRVALAGKSVERYQQLAGNGFVSDVQALPSRKN